ncbi:hypothetical protein RN001_011787 [Aquatica leii]|uniref:Uncharacterized protein n=1 Tax=Aquatica leii TaxID=1421715 RepID=A0AAN7NXR4_9COLE|nr:hypothetical protein RN001_011787 [Aquatica leii]
MNVLHVFAPVAISLKDYGQDSDWCIQQYNLNSQEIYKMHRGHQLPADNNDYLTFIECLWRKIGFLDVYGEINRKEIWRMYYSVAREVYNQGVSRKKADATMDKCKDVTGETPSLRAVNMGNCLKTVNSH